MDEDLQQYLDHLHSVTSVYHTIFSSRVDDDDDEMIIELVKKINILSPNEKFKIA